MTERSHLSQVSRRLNYLVRLRSAFAPFRTAVESLKEPTLETEDRRRLLTLWRPCQRRLDRLLDLGAAGPGLDPLRQEIEDSLRDEVVSLPALVDLAAAFDQACEALLLRLGEELQVVADHVAERPVSEGGPDEPGV
jgi:hypothetical protein